MIRTNVKVVTDHLRDFTKMVKQISKEGEGR
jgi:hypothetical protein